MKRKHTIYGKYIFTHKERCRISVTNNYIEVEFKSTLTVIDRFLNGIAFTPENYPKDNWIERMKGLGFEMEIKEIDELR